MITSIKPDHDKAGFASLAPAMKLRRPAGIGTTLGHSPARAAQPGPDVRRAEPSGAPPLARVPIVKLGTYYAAPFATTLLDLLDERLPGGASGYVTLNAEIWAEATFDATLA